MNILAVAKKNGSVDLTAKQGGTWRFTIQVKNQNGSPMDLTGWSARGQIRKTYSSPDVVKEFNCVVLSPATNGVVQIELLPSDTAQIPAGNSPTSAESTYVYDIELYNSIDVIRILEGKLFVSPEVTK